MRPIPLASYIEKLARPYRGGQFARAKIGTANGRDALAVSVVGFPVAGECIEDRWHGFENSPGQKTVEFYDGWCAIAAKTPHHLRIWVG